MQMLFVLRKSLRATDSPTFAIILTSFSVDFFSFLKWFAIMTLFFCSIKNTIQRLSTTPDFIVYLLFADFSTIIFDFTEIHRFLINFFRLFILANDLTLTITSIRFANAASQNFSFIIIVNLRKLIFWWIWNSVSTTGMYVKKNFLIKNSNKNSKFCSIRLVLSKIIQLVFVHKSQLSNTNWSKISKKVCMLICFGLLFDMFSDLLWVFRVTQVKSFSMRVNLSFELRSINITLKTCKLGWKHISENKHIHKLIASSFDLCIAQNGSVSYK